MTTTCAVVVALLHEGGGPLHARPCRTSYDRSRDRIHSFRKTVLPIFHDIEMRVVVISKTGEFLKSFVYLIYLVVVASVFVRVFDRLSKWRYLANGTCGDSPFGDLGYFGCGESSQIDADKLTNCQHSGIFWGSRLLGGVFLMLCVEVGIA